ncbi:MAG: hypothetical protein HOV87_20025 [Catenulispora sp.]|nr:hypothetical protein [Catenulispora sp.]
MSCRQPSPAGNGRRDHQPPRPHAIGDVAGARLSKRSREAAEKAAGVALAALGVYLLIAQLVR